jgi:hypothetical protein
MRKFPNPIANSIVAKKITQLIKNLNLIKEIQSILIKLNFFLIFIFSLINVHSICFGKLIDRKKI